MKEILYLKDYKHTDIPINEFIPKFLIFYNRMFNTYVKNSEKDEIHTYRGRHRSLGDIHSICTTYYPGISREEVKIHLLNLRSNLVGHYCSTIEKRVYVHKYTMESWKQQSKESLDEYGDLITYLQDE